MPLKRNLQLLMVLARNYSTGRAAHARSQGALRVTASVSNWVLIAQSGASAQAVLTVVEELRKTMSQSK